MADFSGFWRILADFVCVLLVTNVLRPLFVYFRVILCRLVTFPKIIRFACLSQSTIRDFCGFLLLEREFPFQKQTRDAKNRGCVGPSFWLIVSMFASNYFCDSCILSDFVSIGYFSKN